ncbi:MAG: ATP-grasp domain-containing protein, partial [Methylococcales bacterium]|nr:ATP-grasp domain-containing protein [Methylococcales bacterium]
GLWGYVGIDIIQPELNDPWVVEINPRLTTSYVGINQALDFNVAAAVLDMLDKEHVIKKMCNKQITVSITA